MNFYVWAALGVVLIIAIRQADFGPMKLHEQRAIKTGQVLNPESKEKVDTTSNLPVSDIRKISDLVIPLAVLFIAVVGFMYVDGLNALEGERTLINIFGEADVTLALLYGGIIALAATFILFFRHMVKGKLTGSQFGLGIKEGAKSML